MSGNKETIEKYMEGFNKSDHRQILSCLTDNVEWEMPGTFSIVGKASFDKEIENDAFVGNPIVTVSRMVEEDDVVVAEGKVLVKKKDGSFLNAVFCDVFRMENTKLNASFPIWSKYKSAQPEWCRRDENMRKLVAGTFLTLDGVMQAPGGPDEDRDGGFRHGGWVAPYFEEKMGGIMTDWIRRADAFLLGRRTYEIFAGYWPKITDPSDEIAAALNTRPKFVASRTLREVRWNNSVLLKGDVAAEVARLKAMEGNEIQVHGSGDLLQTLLKKDLVDTLRIWLFPVVIGTGKRLFGEGAIPRSFQLVDTERATTGAVLHVYERTGDLRYGTIGDSQ